VNPRIGSDLQYGRGVEEEQTVEVVRNHEDGGRTGNGFPIPKGARGQAETPNRTDPGVLLHDSNDGGAIFGQPHERKPGFAAGSQGPRGVVTDGAKVRRVTQTERKFRERAGRGSERTRPRRPEYGDVLEGHGGQR